MANSLSSPPFHNYQSSPTESQQQRHAGYSNSNSYRNHHSTASKEKSGGNTRFKMSSLRGKSWSSFAEAVGCESSDDETDGDDLGTNHRSSRHLRGSIVRLKKRDISLYGNCPLTDQFAVGVCRHCRMVLKLSALKGHIDRQRHEKEQKERKHDLGEAVVKLEKLADKTSGVTEKFDKISVVVEKFDKSATTSGFNVASEKLDKVEKVIENTKRHRHFQKKTASSENSSDAVQPSAESSSASNSPPQPRRRKRKHVENTTFQNNSTAVTPTTCRIIVEPTEIVIREPASSPPPLAPITNEPQPSVWIVTPASPAVLIDGAFVMKPLEQEEPEIDLKDLKVLKPPMVKESPPETQTLLTPSNWYSTQPRPLAVNTFNMRKLNAQRYVLATQKLIELGRNLRTEEKVGVGSPKTWSFIERSQVFIPFRVTQ